MLTDDTSPVTCFPLLATCTGNVLSRTCTPDTYFPALATAYMFSCACHRIDVFPRLPPVHVFPRLPPLACFLVFFRVCHRVLILPRFLSVARFPAFVVIGLILLLPHLPQVTRLRFKFWLVNRTICLIICGFSFGLGPPYLIACYQVFNCKFPMTIFQSLGKNRPKNKKKFNQHPNNILIKVRTDNVQRQPFVCRHLAAKDPFFLFFSSRSPSVISIFQAHELVIGCQVIFYEAMYLV